MSEGDAQEAVARRRRWPLGRQRMVELAVVVFGVAIALGLENLIEEVRLRGDAHKLEESFRDEIIVAVRLSLERQVIDPCLTGRLRDLTARGNTSRSGWDAAPAIWTGSVRFALPQPYRAPTRVWQTATFDRALGSEAFKRIPRERAEAYAGLFAQIEARRGSNAAEYEAVAGLAPLAYDQTGVDAEVRADLLKTLSLLDRQRALALIQSDQIIDTAMSLPWGDDIRAQVLEFRTNADVFNGRLRETYGDCIDTAAHDRLMALAASRTGGLARRDRRYGWR